MNEEILIAALSAAARETAETTGFHEQPQELVDRWVRDAVKRVATKRGHSAKMPLCAMAVAR